VPKVNETVVAIRT